MSSAWAPLAGVIVGAILGAAAQIVADQLRHKRDLSRAVRAERRAAYSALISRTNELIDAWAMTPRSANGRWVESPELHATFAAMGVVGAAVVDVQLIAPSDTGAAAGALAGYASQASTVRASDDPDNKAQDALLAARQAFLALAKRDLTDLK